MISIHGDGLDYIKKIKDKSVDLILVDPPYLISKKSNFKIGATSDHLKNKYDISIDFGDWDKSDIDYDFLFKEYYRVLKYGGTLIFFFDIWKSTIIKELAIKNKFKQPRVCLWSKNNPVPVNSKSNYLSNAVEYFFTFVKSNSRKGKSTFNSEYDKGIYNYPICSGKERLKHPTQKPIGLINELILKHTNEGDLVLDTFAGTGTVGESCILNNRKFILVEKDDEYFKILSNRINKIKTN